MRSRPRSSRGPQAASCSARARPSRRCWAERRPAMNLVADDPGRLLAACGLAAAWLALCVQSWRSEGARRRRVADEAAALAARPEAARTVLVVHASQTGAAEALAWQTARAL